MLPGSTVTIRDREASKPRKIGAKVVFMLRSCMHKVVWSPKSFDAYVP
jgi:hypothetical protein